MHRTMHILDVISSVSRYSNCTKIVGGCGFAPEPTGGVYSAPPDPLAGFNSENLLLRPLLLRKGEERREEDAKMIYAPGRQKPSRRQCVTSM